MGELAVFSAYGSVFRGGTAIGGQGGFSLLGKARGSMTDCLVIGHTTAGSNGALRLAEQSTFSLLRTTFQDNRATDWGGCFGVASLATLTIDECDILSCWSDGNAGIFWNRGSVTITNSRMAGN